MELLWIVIAGGVGAVLRWYLAKYSGKLPWGILLANIFASFIAGFATASASISQTTANVGTESNSALAVIVVSGLCGGLSTFSSFAANTHLLFQAGLKKLAIANIVLSALLPFVAVLLGAQAAYLLIR